MPKAATKTKPAEQPALFEQHEVLPPPNLARPKAGKVAVAVRELPAPPTNLLAVIANAASSPLVDVQKMKELLAMQREIEQADQARKFNVAMLAAQSEMPRIVKDRANEHTKSRYATLEKVSKEIDPIARKHGFTMSFGTDDSPLTDHYRIVCDLSHSAGATRRYFCDLQADTAGSHGKSNKTPVQGVGSTMSYGRRYLKVMMFDLTIVGEDKDGGKTQTADDPVDEVTLITADQLKKIEDAIKFCGVGHAKFCAHYQIEKIQHLPASLFDDALKACAHYNATKEKKTDGQAGNKS